MFPEFSKYNPKMFGVLFWCFGIYQNIIDEYHNKLVHILHKYFVHKVKKYAGALVSPNGITVNSYSPYLEVKAVLGISSVRTFNWWYPDLKSIFEKTLAYAS